MASRVYPYVDIGIDVISVPKKCDLLVSSCHQRGIDVKVKDVS